MNDLFRFKGQDGSMGYRTGEVYMLELTGRGYSMGVLITAPERVPYDSWNKFLENWERV